MANKTTNLSVNFTNHLRGYAPYTTYKTNSTTDYKVAEETISGKKYQCMLLGKVASFPKSIRHNVLIGHQFTVALKDNYVTTPASSTVVYVYLATSDFDTDTANYDNSRGTDGTVIEEIVVPRNSELTNRTSDYDASPSRAQRIVRSKGILLYYPYVDEEIYARTVLTDGSTKPYFTITYDDSAKIKSKISYANSQLTGSISTGVAKVLTWSLVKDTSISGYCAVEEWEQVSATFNWRVQGASEWNTISVSGSTTSVTIPAYTFPSGATIEYYISETDEDNTTSTTSTYTFTTLTTKVTPTNSPTSGYVNPRNSVTFSWNYVDALGTVEAGASTLHWRVSGSENWTDVQAASGATSLTIPANTFQTASTIEWYLSGTDSSGYASQTSVYSFSTAAGAVTAQAVSPSNTVQSNNQPITFNWTYSSPDGFAPSRYKFMWKLVTDANWTTLVDSTDVVNTYTFPAYTFPAGEIRWEVVPYNIDEVAGTGQSVTFVCYGAPDAPVVYAENAPFTTVTWQASDQQSYRIKVDDVVYGPYFGTEKTFAIPDRLEDGEHTIGVSVVGTYGLWSEWGTSIINVQNVPGAEIVLGGTGGIDTFLSWTTAEATSDFLVFRDGVQIGHTEEITFVDRYAVGEHTYKVINRLPSGNYSESNEVVLESHADGTYISLLDGGEWLKIKYMLKDSSDQQYEESIETVYNHFAGSDYPSVSISRYRERRLSYSAVFLYVDEADHTAFKNMLRKPVVMKFENGNVIAGVIDSWTVIHRKQYYTAYTFTLRQIEFEDYTDDTT